MQKIKVACIIYVEVELKDDQDPISIIEENGCPGTGKVYLALKKLLEEHEEAAYCLMCAGQCKNVICPATVEVK